MKTKKLALATILLGSIVLGGCSSKPSTSDIEKELKLLTEPCKIFKMHSFKKLNGVEHGENEYQLFIQFKIEATRDISFDELRSEDFRQNNCPTRGFLVFNGLITISNKGTMITSYKKGDEFIYESDYLMIRSENGWIIK